MTQKEIIKGNCLIAEWLGYEIDSLAEEDEPIRYYVDNHIECVADGIDYWETFEEDWTSWLYPEQMKFHSSWDWLMPVLTNIEKNFWVTTTTRRGYSAVSIHQPQRGYEKIVRVDSENKLEATWSAIVEFIKWYNTQNK